MAKGSNDGVAQNESQKAARFQPGKSGNPGGRPKWKTEVINLMGQNAAAAAKYLIGVVNNSSAKDKDRIGAAQFIIEQACGKAVQAISDPDGNALPVLTGMTVTFVDPAEQRVPDKT